LDFSGYLGSFSKQFSSPDLFCSFVSIPIFGIGFIAHHYDRRHVRDEKATFGWLAYDVQVSIRRTFLCSPSRPPCCSGLAQSAVGIQNRHYLAAAIL